ncbi:unnamed protein product [Durusdinium trenchii]|uniref:C2HC/C3H-type domain-containing protein n=1 Tax=Durusdinium trenchii TaxID=1381693 RepID=A0ABP0L642_9DINO
MARHDEELPLLASPAPHIEALGASPQPGAQRGIDRSAAQLAWKKLLVNSPPAWAQSPDLLGSRRGEPQLESRIPPFPAWPSSSTTWPFETPSLSQDDEDEIARFLSHCTSFDELLRSTPRAPTATPERRVGAASRLSDQVWSPQQMTGAKPQRSRPSEASTATPPEHHAETSQGFAKLPDTEEVQVPMGSCRGCQRRFRANRLPIHEEICLRNAQKKRSVFESSRQRCEAVTGRWWSDSELRGSQQPNSQSSVHSIHRSPPRARDSKGSPGRPSCPSRRTSVPASPSPFKATPSPAKPRRLWAGGPKISPNASPAKGTPPCRRRSASEGRLTATGEGQASSGARSERRPASDLQAREVKTATSRTASMGRSPARSPGRPGWSTPQAQKIRGEGGSPSPWAVPAMPEPSQSQGSIARSDTKGGSLLGTIIDDVAQLSAQVERLLNRRKDLLSDFQQTEEILREVVALSPSDASQEGDGRRP